MVKERVSYIAFYATEGLPFFTIICDDHYKELRRTCSRYMQSCKAATLAGCIATYKQIDELLPVLEDIHCFLSLIPRWLCLGMELSIMTR